MFDYIDDFLFDKVFEPFSHSVQKWIGWTCFTLGRICVAFWLIFSVISEIWNFVAGKYSRTELSVHLVVDVAVSLFMCLACHFAEEDCRVGRMKNCSNPNRLQLAIVRMWMLCLYSFASPVLLLSWVFVDTKYLPLHLVAFFFMISMFYFISCTPLPPGKSKIRQVWEKLKDKIFGGELAPVPA